MRCVNRVWGSAVALALFGACGGGCAMSEYDTALGQRGPATGQKYQGVMAGYDANSADYSVDGVFQAKFVEAGPAAPTAMQMVYRVGTGSVKVASGDVTGSDFTATSPDGWTFMGAMEQQRLVGEFSDELGNANGEFAAVKSDDGAALSLLGDYDGDASGSWNYVISSEGRIEGAFFGDADGHISGNLVDHAISLTWTGTSFLTTVTGTATATLSADNTTADGQWSGADAGGDQFAGTFAGSVTDTDLCEFHQCADACSQGQICITEYGCVPPLHPGTGPEATKCAFSSSLALDLQCDPICIRAACDSTTPGEYLCFCEPECAMAEPSG